MSFSKTECDIYILLCEMYYKNILLKTSDWVTKDHVLTGSCKNFNSSRKEKSKYTGI